MGARVIAMLHERRLLPLMWWAQRLDEMVTNVPLEGTMLVMGELDREEIKKRIKLVLKSVPPNTVLDVHLPMRPNDGFIEMVSVPHFFSPPFSLGLFVFHFA
jgi:D-mannonate dehydratase